MLIVACLLLPAVTALLYCMDRVEDWLTRAPQPARHARTRHLRLIPGGEEGPASRKQAGRRRPDAA